MDASERSGSALTAAPPGVRPMETSSAEQTTSHEPVSSKSDRVSPAMNLAFACLAFA